MQRGFAAKWKKLGKGGRQSWKGSPIGSNSAPHLKWCQNKNGTAKGEVFWPGKNKLHNRVHIKKERPKKQHPEG